VARRCGESSRRGLVLPIYHGNMARLSVFLTVYDRLDRLERTINLFKRQRRKDFDLFIVNNSDREIIVDMPCTIINMGNKYKHYGRYFAVRDILDDTDRIIAFMDDDIEFSTNYVMDCYKHYDPRFVKSFWAFQIADDYWVRKRINGATNGHYCGAGGLLAPPELFMVPELYLCPEEYWVMDDIWMSHVILSRTEYKIRNFPTPVKFIDDDKASYKKLRKQKSEMAKKYLVPYR
jgi:glycosyltransferase involved in cell wall biosynthesis